MKPVQVISASAGSGKTSRLARHLAAEIREGRVRPEGGDLKVDDLVLPERAATVRRRAAWLDARRGDARAVDAVLRERPRVLVVDHAHHLHGDARAGAALAAAAQGGTTLVLGTTDPDVLPPGVTSTHLLTLMKGE